MDRYNVSKLLEVFYCRELAVRSKESNKSDVIINFLNPGLCHSELGKDAPIFFTILKFFLARTTECGSRTLVHATEAGEESHGQYLSSCHVTPYVLHFEKPPSTNDVQAINVSKERRRCKSTGEGLGTAIEEVRDYPAWNYE